MTVDLDAETRIDRATPHWIQVQSLTEDGVVATKLLTLDSAVPAMGSKPGRAGSNGLAVSAREWSVPYVAPASDASTVLEVLNAGSRSATLTVDVISAGAVTAFAAPAPIEVLPGRVVTVDVTSAAPSDAVAIELRADQPVLVERRTSGTTRDLTVQPALPHLGSIVRVQSVYVDGTTGS